jgi:hypothetical protein
MRLHEEYILRNKLDVPIVRYDRRSQAILRSKFKPYCWRIISIVWRANRRGPGFFEISCKKPVHNGYIKEHVLDSVLDTQFAYWENYENLVLGLAKMQKEDFEAISTCETEFASWCIFSFIYDNWLALNVSPEFFHYLSGVFEHKGDNRLKCMDMAKKFIKDKKVEEAYEYQIKPWAGVHSEWLANLINE